MRSIADGMDPAVVTQIDQRLNGIEVGKGVSLLLAIESGSRAWGFPSPDSDYDCRFLFVRRMSDYLSPWQKRDVIETPLDKVFDVNGWELGKALKLLLKGNAVVIEWLTSQVVYQGDPEFRQELLELADAHADRVAIGRHYLHLGERQRRTYFADEKSVALKKLFYALRPAAALRWLRSHPNARVAPMHFQTLMAESDPPADVRRISDELLVLKAVTHELGTGPLPAALAEFMQDEFDAAQAEFDFGPRAISHEAREAATAFFARTVLAHS